MNSKVILLVLYCFWFSAKSQSSIVNYSWNSTICIGDASQKKHSNCSVVFPSFKSALEVSNNTLIQILDKQVTINNNISFVNKTGIGIQGVAEGTNLACDNGTNIGMEFVAVTDLFLHRIVIRNCGALHYSTTINGSDYQNPSLFKVAIYMENCTNVEMVNVTIDNSIGTGLAMFDCTGLVNIHYCSFTNNRLTDEEVNLTSGGGGLYMEFSECSSSWLNRCNPYNIYNRNAVYFINQCLFQNNIRTMHKGIRASVVHTAMYNRNGHGGGGLCTWLRGNSANNTIRVSNSVFENNTARFGAGFYIHFQQTTAHNYISLNNNSFKFNKASRAGGGMDIASYFLEPSIPQMNTLNVSLCMFEGNEANTGGGCAIFSAVSYSYNFEYEIEFYKCTWFKNIASFGSALSIVSSFTTAITNRFGPMPSFTSCDFIQNIIRADETRSFTGNGAIYAKVLSLRFKDSAVFESNEGTAVTLVASNFIVSENTQVMFFNNTGNFGGAVYLIGFSAIRIKNNTFLSFISNHAFFRGGAIYVYSIDEQVSNAFGTCFVERYWMFDSSSMFDRPTFYFKNNTAVYPNSGSMYVSTLLPCLSFCSNAWPSTSKLIDVLNDCIGNFTFDGANVEDEVATEGSVFILEDPGNPDPYLITVPGKEVLLPFEVEDEVGHTVTETLRTSLVSKNNSSLSIDTAYITNNKLLFFGQPKDMGELNVGSTYFRNLSFRTNVWLSECPPGFSSKDNMCVCSAQIEGEKYTGILSCDSENLISFVSLGFWVGYVTDNEETDYGENDLYTSICPLGYCNNSGQNGIIKLSLPSTPSKEELDKVICGGENRQGVLCGECIANHSVYFHSWEYNCGHNDNCDLGILFYFLSDIFPLTLVFTVIILCGINFNSGIFNGFVLYAQLLQSLSTTANGAIIYTTGEIWLEDSLRLIYGPFNLNFFKIDKLSFCIFQDANFLWIIFMEFVTLLYGLLLVITLVYLMRSRLCYKLQIACFKRGITNTTSLTQGLSAFLILCYSQATRICFQILNIGWLTGKGTSTYYPARVFRMGTLEYFTGMHIPFAIGAIIGLLTIVAIPPALLLSYPVFYKIIPEEIQKKGVLKVILRKIENYRPIFDTFQSCFKDDYRYFAGLHFLYRSLFITLFAFVNSRLTFFATTQILLTIILSLHLWIQPYKISVHNFIDGSLYFILAVVNILTMWRYFLSYVQIKEKDVTIAGYFQVILLYLPVLVIACYIVYHLFKLCFKRYHKACCPNIRLFEARKIDESICLSELHNINDCSYEEFTDDEKLDESRTDIHVL